MVVAYLLAAILLVLAGWMIYRRRPASKLSIEDRSTPASAGVPAAHAGRVEIAGRLAAQRLWRLAFGAPSPASPQEAAPPSESGPPAEPASPRERAHRRVRELVCAILEVDTLDPNYFPRRPTLMPQLLQAVNDSQTTSEKLSRIIAHDPVLTADVLRLANSSLYRISPAPIESVQRAIVVCGVDELRGILATAMLRPVFRASRSNFPRLPRMLWDRTERAVRAAELYAAKAHPEDRFEAQMLVLLSALGPLVVYSAALDGYSRVPQLTPDPALFVELIVSLGPQMSQRIARDWQTSPRLLAALEKPGEEALADALHVGELLGTLSFLQSQTVISEEEGLEIAHNAGLPDDVVHAIWTRLAGTTHGQEPL